MSSTASSREEGKSAGTEQPEAFAEGLRQLFQAAWRLELRDLELDASRHAFPLAPVVAGTKGARRHAAKSAPLRGQPPPIDWAGIGGLVGIR
jgi:hypothetical protein